MAVNRHVETVEIGDVVVVRFMDRKIHDEDMIQEIGKRLIFMVETEKRKKLLLNFANVEIVTSSALGKFIELHKKAMANKASLKLSNLRPEIYDVMAITKLNKLFDIKPDEAAALAAF